MVLVKMRQVSRDHSGDKKTLYEGQIIVNSDPLLGCSRSRVSGAALAFQSQPHTPHRMSHLLKTTMFAPPIACLLNVTSGF
ncbi:hypothetical protein RRG08_062397 [Elysia crispata]|uniref:Uncharacterized protein n=1 Tax=Elysia crispata TaxID=231223 RepID=A0AAE1AVL8_9GAST|nr:hypothetical protein RRG08_062397 [Elysia crispata]